MSRRKFAVAAAIGLAALGAVYFSEPGGRSGGTGFAFRKPVLGPLETPGLSAHRAPTGGAAEPSGGSEFDQFMDLLNESEKMPLAAEFAKEFVKEPALRKAFEEYRDGQRAPAQAENIGDFARRVGSRVEFQRLLAKFSQEPGFRQMVEPLLRMPQLRAAVREQLLAHRAAKTGGARSALASATSLRGGAPPRRSGAGSGSRTEAPGVPPRLSGRSGVSGRVPAEEGGSPEGSAGSDALATQREEADGPAVDRTLRAILGAGSGKDAASALASLCYRKDPAITQAECDAIEGFLGDYGIWDACLKAGLFDKCKALCDQKPELACGSPPGFYETCLAAGEPDCVARCAAMPGCVAPPAAPPVASPAAPPVNPKIAECRNRGGGCFWIWAGGGDCCCPGNRNFLCPQ